MSHRGASRFAERASRGSACPALKGVNINSAVFSLVSSNQYDSKTSVPLKPSASYGQGRNKGWETSVKPQSVIRLLDANKLPFCHLPRSFSIIMESHRALKAAAHLFQNKGCFHHNANDRFGFNHYTCKEKVYGWIGQKSQLPIERELTRSIH